MGISDFYYYDINEIEKAKFTFELIKKKVDEYFINFGKLLKRNNNVIVKIEDFKLFSYACYLIV